MLADFEDLKLNTSKYPNQFWHCAVKIDGNKSYSVVNDLEFIELDRTIVSPWLSGRPFTVGGMIVNPGSSVQEIKIAHTPNPKQYYADQHNARSRGNGVMDFATNRSLLPFSQRQDFTYDFLFSALEIKTSDVDLEFISRVCERLPNTARVLELRSRKGKSPFLVQDEYDVQDLLHGTLRAYLKYSVQEDSLPRVASAKSSRIDISIEDLGILIEIKFVRGPSDQKRVFEEYSQDLILYSKWSHLKSLIFIIYNSRDLRDPEAFEKLGGPQEIEGRRFNVKMVLA